MAEQLDIFAPDTPAPRPKPRAYARHTDPDTSHEAAARIEAHVTPLEHDILAALRKRGARGGTSYELSEQTKIERITLAPRLKPMEKAGVIRRTEDRRPGPTGRPGIVWVAL